MLKLKFLINRRLLAYRYGVYLFTTKDRAGEKLRRTLEHRYGDYAGFHIFIPGQMQYAIMPDWRDCVRRASVRFLVRDISIVDAALTDIVAAPEFRAVYEETQAYLTDVRTSWQSHSLEVAQYFSDLFYEWRDTTLSILLFPPRMKVGSYLGTNTIEWG